MVKDKVFFIISNLSKFDGLIEYSLSKGNGMTNFNSILKKTDKFKGEEFTTYVFYFDIYPEELQNEDKDIRTKKYKANIILKYENTNFEAEILFKEDKNNFIYDFKFEDYKGWTGNKSPPIYINYPKVEQIKLFIEVLKILKLEQCDKLFKNLVTDSQCYITGQTYFLDFYLEILKSCYTQKEIKTLLMMFKLARTMLPEKIEIKEYTSILGNIEKDPSLITRHCSEKDNKEKYLKSFYTILLFFRYNYEKEKLQNLLNNKDLNKYFIEILPINYQFFINLDVPDELIFEILNQKNISFKIIFGILSYIHSIEKLLLIINNNNDIIANCCLNVNAKINMSELANPKETDDLNKIINEIGKLLNYQLNNKKIFFLFDEEFWKNYIQYNDKKNLKNLVLINKVLLLYQKVDKYFNSDKLGLKMKIHATGLLAIEKGELKNEELIDFIENEDIYFKDRNYESKGFRPLSVLKGIDLENADDKFFEKWNKSNIFKIYSFIDIEFKKELINKIDDMKDFGKLFKLFDYNDKKKFNKNTGALIRDKFINLLKTYEIEKCPNFIHDISLFIYIIDQRFQGIKEFLENKIEINIQPPQTINDIYLYLDSNYENISQNLIDTLANYFIENKDKLNGENILFLLKQLN